MPRVRVGFSGSGKPDPSLVFILKIAAMVNVNCRFFGIQVNLAQGVLGNVMIRFPWAQEKFNVSLGPIEFWIGRKRKKSGHLRSLEDLL